MVGEDGFLADFLDVNSSHGTVSMPSDSFTRFSVQSAPIMNLAHQTWWLTRSTYRLIFDILQLPYTCPRFLCLESDVPGITEHLQPPCTHPRFLCLESQVSGMAERITVEELDIVKVNDEPQMDIASVEGTAEVDGKKWLFRGNQENLQPGDALLAVVERSEDESGQYLRIHEILEYKNKRYA